jgi:type VI secretion system secreted protein VgrG
MSASGALAAVQSLFNSFTQSTRLIQLTTPAGPNQLLVECVRAEEGISQGYRLQIAALSTDAAIPLKSLIGQPVLLELLTAGTGKRRPFHGHVTRIEMSGANGGFARYELTVEPWTAFLAKTRDSRVFQDRSVFDIIDTVFARYQGQGTLAPAWRFDVRERAVYPLRSHTTQYRESDLAFVQRLMDEEKLFHFFRHTRENHELVIADHNGAFEPNSQETIRFTQSGAVMKEDSIDRWNSESSLGTNAIEIASWDYRSRGMRPVGAASIDPGGIALARRDCPGVYAYSGREQGARMANNQMQALEASRAIQLGEGTVRTLEPGTTFTLTDHAGLDAGEADDRTLLVVRACHVMHNNLRAEMRAGVQQGLGNNSLDGEVGAERVPYRNRVEAIRSSIVYRSAVRQLRPLVSGQQTAIVVGPAGAVVHTDRDHRIKVQFHWQRGEMSHSRLAHPAPDGHVGAPSDDSAGSWVRVAAPLAGANWGSVAVPRIGQEVLIDFMEGDIDRPVVVGALYNGRGQRDAQHNEMRHGAGAASGNAPAWFPGESGAHAHPAALSGIKTQAMSASQGGAGAYNQLVFDDSPGQSRTALQQHASAHRGTAELNLGHLRHQSDNQRLQTVGFGAELKTEFSAALRGGQGMLLSADARNGATGSQLDSKEALAQIEQSHQLQMSLATTAQAHNARLKDEGGKDEPEPNKLAAIAQQEHSKQVIKAAGHDAVTAYNEPQLQLSAPAGIAATTAAHAIFSAGNTSSVTAGQDINFASEGGAFHIVKAGICLFTYGKASNKEKPNQETGVKLHAASGKVSSQSQSGETRLTADKMVTVASVTKSVTIGAKHHVLMTAQGAYLKLEGGNIMLHGPGKIEFKASVKEFAGPKNGSAESQSMPKAAEIYNQAFVVRNEDSGEPMAHVPYRVESAEGVTITGVTDAAGRTQRLFTRKKAELKLFLPEED